jgi:hypothetical protein
VASASAQGLQEERLSAFSVQLRSMTARLVIKQNKFSCPGVNTNTYVINVTWSQSVLLEISMPLRDKLIFEISLLLRDK